jgi:nucleotide-binding universal stress UspA family protein
MDTPHDSIIRPNRLLLATDGSEDAVLAARVATDLSLRTGARLHVAHAWYHLVKGLTYPTLLWADYSDLYERAETLGVVMGRRSGMRLVDADATLALLQVAEEGEERKSLLAVGSRGLGAVDRARLGSVSTNVLRAARGPVLIYSSGP